MESHKNYYNMFVNNCQHIASHIYKILTGENIERGGKKAEDLIKQSFEYGNAIANHSWSHDYHTLYPNRTLNLENFLTDFKKTDDILKDILGPYFSTRVIRCPGGHMSWKGMDELDTYLNENNIKKYWQNY